MLLNLFIFFFFFFNDTATTEIYTLSLHDALPIYRDDTGAKARKDQWKKLRGVGELNENAVPVMQSEPAQADRKSTRLNSSHSQISYAVFCLKKKKKTKK